VVSVGVGDPIPTDLRVLRNNVGDFFFSIFAVDSSTGLTCTYSVTGIEPLSVTFDDPEVFVEAGGEKIVYGTINVPENAPIKSYSGIIKVTCEPKVEMGVTGSKIIQSTLGSFKLSVVEKLEEQPTLPVLPEEEEKTGIPTAAILVIIVVIVIILSVYFLYKRKKSTEPSRV